MHDATGAPLVAGDIVMLDNGRLYEIAEKQNEGYLKWDLYHTHPLRKQVTRSWPNRELYLARSTFILRVERGDPEVSFSGKHGQNMRVFQRRYAPVAEALRTTLRERRKQTNERMEDLGYRGGLAR